MTPPAKPEAPATHEKIVKSCDILVIGGGGSGLVAAAKAAHAGKRVVLLEKNFETGGSAWFGHMMRVHWSKWHQAAGIPDKREKLYETFLKKTQGRCNNKLAAAFWMPTWTWPTGLLTPAIWKRALNGV